jgi:hypothetical protein
VTAAIDLVLEASLALIIVQILAATTCPLNLKLGPGVVAHVLTRVLSLACAEASGDAAAVANSIDYVESCVFGGIPVRATTEASSLNSHNDWRNDRQERVELHNEVVSNVSAEDNDVKCCES